MFNKKKNLIKSLKNNNVFLNKQNVDLRKSNEKYQLTNVELGNQCEIFAEEIAQLKKEKKNLKRKLTMLEKEINDGRN